MATKRILHLFVFLLCGLSHSACAQAIITVAGSGAIGYSGDGGPATNARLNNPQGVAIDPSGNLYIADRINDCIRKVDAAGIITTVAGNGTPGYSGDGGLATDAQLDLPRTVAVDAAGNLFIADEINNCIRKVDAAGIITTYAGNNTPGFSGDSGPATAAQLHNPFGVAVDHSGKLYFSDLANARIRMVDAVGIITTVAGGGTMTADSIRADSAYLLYPAHVAVDNMGSFYFTDHFKNVVRKVNAAGIIINVAGNTTAGYSGDGGSADSAELNMPYGVAIDGSGNLYIGDTYNNLIRKVDPTGMIMAVAGNRNPGYSGDGGGPTFAQLNYPVGVGTDAIGNLYIADNANNRIRMIAANHNHPPLFTHHVKQAFPVYENTATTIDTFLKITDPDVGQTETWSVVYNPLHGILTASATATSTGTVLTPALTVYTPATGYTGADTFTVQVTDSIATTTTLVYVNVVSPLHIGGITEGSLTIYPNPSRSYFTVQLPRMANSANITITDLSGNVLRSENIVDPKNRQTIYDTRNMAPGLYIMKVVCGDQVYREKILVE